MAKHHVELSSIQNWLCKRNTPQSIDCSTRLRNVKDIWHHCEGYNGRCVKALRFIWHQRCLFAKARWARRLSTKKTHWLGGLRHWSRMGEISLTYRVWAPAPRRSSGWMGAWWGSRSHGREQEAGSLPAVCIQQVVQQLGPRRGPQRLVPPDQCLQNSAEADGGLHQQVAGPNAPAPNRDTVCVPHTGLPGCVLCGSGDRGEHTKQVSDAHGRF